MLMVSFGDFLFLPFGGGGVSRTGSEWDTNADGNDSAGDYHVMMVRCLYEYGMRGDARFGGLEDIPCFKRLSLNSALSRYSRRSDGSVH